MSKMSGTKLAFSIAAGISISTVMAPFSYYLFLGLIGVDLSQLKEPEYAYDQRTETCYSRHHKLFGDVILPEECTDAIKAVATVYSHSL